jgi:vacuolar-type H+-ATPase subunit H
MSTHPLTDIHEAEKEADQRIEKTKKNNDKSILEARDKEETALQSFIEAEKEVGMDLLKRAKKEANEMAKREMAAGEQKTIHIIKEAKMRSDQGVRCSVQAFTEYVNL